MKEEKEFLGNVEPINLSLVMPRFFIRSKTNEKEFAKQYFVVIKSDNTDPALLIRKLILSNNFRLYANCELLKTYKGMGLFEDRFGIKLSTLKAVFYALNWGQRTYCLQWMK